MKNYVQIQTSEGMGSGVILSCEIDSTRQKLLKKDEKSYIVLTNYHVIQDIEQDNNCYNDKKGKVKLRILDIYGEEIEQRMIQHVYIRSGNNYACESDVAALLVIIKDCCEIPCCDDIYMGDHSKKMVEIYGYPHIFQSNWINQDICMEGVIQKYTKDGIGLYTIKDDYHSYSNISDKSLMEGLSGAPVYLTENNKTYLVGINESVCNIGEGNNPFKMVYFLSIDQVLSWLAQQHIILYRYSARSVKIIWIAAGKFDLQESGGTLSGYDSVSLDLEESKNIVLIGSSGAGKSSFLSTLCQHGKQLGSVGDGQTTRDTITYHLDVDEDNPRVEISFQSSNDFIERRKNFFRWKRYELILVWIYGMQKRDIIENPCCYLQDLIMPLVTLKKVSKDAKEIGELLEKINQRVYDFQHTYDKDDLEGELWGLYEEIISFLKAFFDEEHINSALKKFFLNTKSYDDYREKQSDGTWEQFYEYLLKSTEQEIEKPKDIEEFKKEFKKELRQILTSEEGYYDISDFDFLDEREKSTGWNDIFERYFEDESMLNRFEQDLKQEAEAGIYDDEKREITFLQRVENYYDEIYATIKRELKDQGIDIGEPITYSLEMLTPKEKNIIARCMRKVGRESLTGIVARVNVFDRISDTYAFDIYQHKIKRIRMYDTCGYDHIERQYPRVYYKSLFNEINDRERRTGQDSNKGKIDAFIYVKKLDSGKPVELEKILPIINNMEPTVPIFCLFAAIDQYMDVEKKLSYNIIWDKEYYERWESLNGDNKEFIFPKSVQSLYENNKLKELIQAPKIIKDKVVEFIQNHMMPYVSKYEVNDENAIALNRNSISYILRSVLLDEWNMGFVLPSKDIGESGKSEGEKNKDLKDAIRQDLKDAIRQDLKRMFENASRTNWERRHHSTVRANFRRIYRFDEEYDRKEKDLGFTRTSIDRWDNLLEGGYKNSFLAADGGTICIINEKYGLSEKNAYNIVARLEKKIITASMGKWEGDNAQDDFRSFFEKLYKRVKLSYGSGESKDIDIFQRQEKISISKNQMVSFLNQVCDFKSMIDRHPDIEDHMVDYIEKVVEEEIKNNNDIYLDKLYKYDQNFRVGMDYIRKVLVKHMDQDDLLPKILEEWIREKLENESKKGESK